MADNLLDKASILLTPTAYNDGSMLAVKPEIALGVDLADGWTFTSGWNVFGGGTSVTNSTTFISESGQGIYTGLGLVAGKKYKILISGTQPSGGYLSIKAGTTGTSFGNITEQSFDKIIYVTPSTVTGVGNSFYIRLANHAVNTSINITKLQIQEDLSGDFTFSRSSAATRVNAQGLVENVQIISSELVSNGNFSQIGTEEVSNGNFSQIGSELVTNGDFATDSDWTKLNATISGGKGNLDGDGQTSLLYQNILTQNKSYKATFTVSNYNGLGGAAIINSNGDNYYTITENGTFTIFFKHTYSNGLFYFRAINGAIYSIDNVSVKEVGQDWSLGSGWSVGDGKAISDGTSSNLIQSISGSANKNFSLTFTISNYISGSVIPAFVGNSSDSLVYSSNGTFTEVISSGSDIRFVFYGASFNASITNISVKEVGQDWTILSPWTVGNNVLSIDGSQVSNQYTSQVVSSLTSGSKYKLQYTVSNITAGQFRINVANTLGTYVSSNGTYEFVFNATSGTTLQLQASTTLAASVTNVSVKEITDDTDLPRINYEGFSYQDSLGSELVVNGGFDTDSDWNNSVGNDWQIVNGKLILTTTSPNNINQGIGLVQNKFYKIVFTISNTTLGGVRIRLGTGSFTSTYTDGTHTLYLQQTTTNDAFRFYANSSGVFNGSIDNVSVKEVLGQEVVPDSGCGSWLLEGQSTNLIPYSEDFSLSNWLKSGSSVESGYLSPSEEANASKFTALNTDPYLLYSVSGVTNLTYSASVYIKGTTSTIGKTARLWIIRDNVVFHNEDFTITDSWQRISTTKTFTTTPTSFVSLRVDLPDTNVSIGDETYIWGAQLEQQSYATSYIPTNGATNTRLQDIATNSGNSTLINSTEGVLYAEMSFLSTTSSPNRRIAISDGTTANRILIQNVGSTANRLQFYTIVNFTTSTDFYADLSDITSFNKIAFKYKENDFSVWVNGIKILTDTSGATFPTETLTKLAFDDGAGNNNFYGKTKALAVYKEALTDANLRSLTYPNPVATTFDLDFDTIAEQFTFTRGSEATFVNAQGLIESTASNDAPRIDYSTGAKAFLLENQSTNLITQSELFSDSYWTKGGSSVVSGFTSPSGVLSAFKLVEDTATTTHQIQRSFSFLNQKYSLSAFLKADERNWIKVNLYDGSSSVYAYFDLTNGVVGQELGAMGKIENYGNGWYRCSITTTLNVSAGNGNISLRLAENNGGTGYVGDGTSGVYIYGAMLEQQSYSTSYIPTSGATATRNQELCNNATPVINSEEGTLYAEISALADDGTNRIFGLSNNSTFNESIVLRYSSVSNRISAQVRKSGSYEFTINYDSTDVTAFSKIAFKYKQNDFALWVNGIEVGVASSGDVISGLDTLGFSFVGGNNFFGNTKGLKYYPKALADVQLEDLTTI